MTKYKCRKKPSGLYNVTVITPGGPPVVIYDMEEARKNNLVRVIREFNAEAERQRTEQKTTKKQ